LKPNREIYEKLIEKLKCKPEEILFIDDKEKNVNSAIDLGINGIVYKKETIVRDVNRFLNFDDLKLFKDFQR
jgi:FMN phosphatase YigB (HAD superfamily)